MIFVNFQPPGPSPEQVAEIEAIIDAACEHAAGACSEPGGDLVEMHHAGPSDAKGGRCCRE